MLLSGLESRARDLLDNLGLQDRINHLPSQFLGGEYHQRKAYVVPWKHNPDILLQMNQRF